MQHLPDPISISVEGLAKRFNREWIFRSFSYEFRPGNTYAIIGPNGSGKSTLLSILWGQTPPTEGKLHYQQEGRNIPEDEIYRHASIATPYMDLIEDFTLMEMVAFHFSLKPLRRNISLNEVIERLYLQGNEHKFIRNFSSGMRQRIKLGLAVLTDAPVLFLDEPGSHLDEVAFKWYRGQLATLPPTSTVFIGSNDPAEYEGATQIIDLRSYKQ